MNGNCQDQVLNLSMLAFMLGNAYNHIQKQDFFFMLEDFIGRLEPTEFENELKLVIEQLSNRDGEYIYETLKEKPEIVFHLAEPYEENAFELIQTFGDEIATVSWDDDMPGQSGYARVMELCGIYIYEASHAPGDGPDRDVKPMIKRLNLFGSPDLKSWISADYDHLID